MMESVLALIFVNWSHILICCYFESLFLYATLQKLLSKTCLVFEWNISIKQFMAISITSTIDTLNLFWNILFQAINMWKIYVAILPLESVGIFPISNSQKAKG